MSPACGAGLDTGEQVHPIEVYKVNRGSVVSMDAIVSGQTAPNLTGVSTSGTLRDAEEEDQQ